MSAPNTQTTIDPDPQSLVAAADRGGFGAAITLVTTGGVVSGIVTGRSAWGETFIEQADTGEGSEQQSLAVLREALLTDDTGPSECIHLKQAAGHQQSIALSEMQGRIPLMPIIHFRSLNKHWTTV